MSSEVIQIEARRNNGAQWQVTWVDVPASVGQALEDGWFISHVYPPPRPRSVIAITRKARKDLEEKLEPHR